MRATLLLALLCACHDHKSWPAPDNNCAGGDWTQWGRGAAHSGTACPAAQPLVRALADVVYDPFVADERSDSDGDLVVHYQSPLLSGDDVFIEAKEGTYTPCNPPGSGTPDGCGSWDGEIWFERKYTWTDGALALQWAVQSDWKPPDLPVWEPVFHGALGDGVLYLPGAGGSVLVVDSKTGETKTRIDPFSLDGTVYVTSPISVDYSGKAVWTAVQFGAQRHGFLLRGAPDGTFDVLSFDSTVPGAPAATDRCEVGYHLPDPQHPPPLPLEDDAGNILPAPTVACGFQRPQLNAAPAVARDGTIYVATRGSVERWSYLVAVNQDFTVRWATSLRGIVHEGCGITIPKDGQPGNCFANVDDGLDPHTGLPANGLADDSSTASPVALPDGRVLYGALSYYNGSRGHTLLFDAAGKFVKEYDFGWDTTPAYFQHGSTYSIVLKDNHYATSGPYYITQLDKDLNVEWQFQSTNKQSCARAPADGRVQCVQDGKHENGFEWCVNALAIDADGTVYVNSEDGNLYSIYQGGALKQQLFLDTALGAAYTPLTLDAAGRIYTQNAGHLFVVGQ